MELSAVSILTNQTKRGNSFWLSQTTLLPGWTETLHHPTAGLLSYWQDLLWGWRMFRARRQFDAVVTGSERAAFVFILLQLFTTGDRVPHVLIYTHWNLPRPRLLRILKRFEYRLLAVGVSAIIVYSERQRQRYASNYRVPLSKVLCVPYHTTLDDAHYSIREGDYIFTGGDFTRDYATLIEAVSGTQWRVIIAARFRSYFNNISVSKNVEIVTTTHDEFCQLMAGSAVVVIPLAGGLMHSGGQQSYLNAMAMGKPVIVADDCGADEYIESGVNGLVVPPGDTRALRDALTLVLSDRDTAKRLGDNARAASLSYSPECFSARVLRIVRLCVDENRSRVDLEAQRRSR